MRYSKYKILRSILLFSLSLVFWLITSCQFESDEIFEDSSVTPADPPQIEIRRLEIDVDSIFLYNPVLIKYAFHAGINKIYGTEVLIDGITVASFESGSGEFLIDPMDYFIGYHSLNIKIYTNSNSGSIADLIGREGYEFVSHKWTFYSIHERTRSIGYSSRIKQNGELEIRWDSCDYQGITYFLERYLDRADGPLMDTISSFEPGYTDHSYSGEEAVYKLFVADSESSIRIPWGYFTLRKDIPEPKMEIIQKKFALHWTPKTYFQNLKGFRISDITTGELLFECANSDTLVYLEGFRFGDYRHLYLTPVSKNDSEPFLTYPESFSGQFHGRIGIPVKHLREANSGKILTRGRGADILYEEDNNVKTYKLDTRTVVDSLFPERQPDYSTIRYEASLSASRNLFCILSHSHNALFYGQSNDLKNHQTFELPFDMLRTNAYIFDDKDEILLWYFDQLYFLSKSQNKIVDTLTVPNEFVYSTVVHYSKFSPDGEYYTHHQGSTRYMFKFERDGFTPLYEFDTNYPEDTDRIIFHPENNSLMFYNSGSTIETRRIEDFSLVSGFPFHTDHNLRLRSVNVQTNQFLVIDEAERLLHVQSLGDGSNILSLPAVSHQGIALLENALLFCEGALFEYGAD